MHTLSDRSSNVLVVVAHPDDEVLGCGATGAELAAAGASVRACILCGEVAARANRPPAEELRQDMLDAQAELGFGAPFTGTFPNIGLNAVPQIELVQFIEGALVESRASMVFTHHPRDLNNDHLHVSLACQAAVHLWRRRSGVTKVRDFLLMETLSSTDWSVRDGREPFEPDSFFSVSEESLAKKLKALACYRGVMRPAPHSRSVEVVRALAAIRGAQCGSPLAEAFQTAFRVLSS